MSTNTTNYNLIKPEDTDNADLKIFVGQNMDTIDSELKTLSDAISSSSTSPSVPLTGVRYIRDTTNGSTQNANNYWIEIQAIDGTSTNVALNKTVTSSSLPIAGTITMVTDGDTTNTSGHYVALSSGMQWVEVDLGSTMDIKSISIFRYSYDARIFHNVTTEVSEDGSNWYMLWDSSVDGEYAESASGKTITFDYTKLLPSSQAITISSFRAYPSAVTNISTANTLTKVSFQTKDYDVLSEYDTTTSRFTASKTGLYVLTASLGIGVVTTPQLQLAVYKNGSIWFYLNHFYSGSVTSAPAIDISGSSVVKLSAGDYLEIYCASSVVLTTTNGVLANSQRSYFSIVKVG